MRPGSTVSRPELERTSAAIPEIGFCKHKHTLLTRFVEAVHEIGRISQQQMQAVLREDGEFERFEPLLHAASQKKDAAKYALLSHIEAHQC